MFLYFSKFGSQYSITFQIYGYARVTYLRFLRFCWDFCKFTFFAMQRLVQSSVRYNFFCNCYCYHYFSKNVIPTVVTTFLKNIIATLLAIRFKLSTYLNDWILKNLCIWYFHVHQEQHDGKFLQLQRMTYFSNLLLLVPSLLNL